MIPMADVACAVMLSWNAAVGATALPRDTIAVEPRITMATLTGPAAQPTGLGLLDASPADTVRKPRKKAFVYSDAYTTRVTLHRRLAWTMLPLFAASYFSGNELLKAAGEGRPSASWARNVHGPAATGSAILFGANALTGSVNLWEGKGDPNGRVRRVLHSVLFMAASGGFVYAGTKLANDAEQSQDLRIKHRNIAIASMGVSTFSWLIMLIGN